MGKAHAVAMSAVGAVFDTALRPRLEMVAASSPASALPAGLRAAVLADAACAAVSIALDGDGFPTRRRPRVFQPSFTVRPCADG